MDRKKSIRAAVLLALFLTHPAMTGQIAQSKSHLIYVLEVRVKTSKVEEFENALRELIGYFTKYEFPRSMIGDISDDFIYFLSTPLESYGDIDILYKDLAEIQNKLDGHRFRILHNQFKETYESIRSGVILKRPDLSYIPNEPRLNTMEARYMRMDAFYIKAGQEEEFEDFCKVLGEQWHQKNAPEPFSVYTGLIGMETPVYYLSMTGKNPVDFWSHAGRIWDPKENEFQKIRKNILPLLRKWEFNTGWLRLDLTFMPKKKRLVRQNTHE